MIIKRTAQLLSLGFIINAALTVHTYEAFLLFGFGLDWWFNLEPKNATSVGISGGKGSIVVGKYKPGTKPSKN